MLSSSLEFKKAIRENTKCTISAGMTFKDTRHKDLTGKHFMSGTASFDEATSASGTFEIGAAIMKTFSCVLNNFDGQFNGYDFTDAVITPTVRKQLSGREELIPKGTFYVEQPYSIGKTITITAYDKMKFFEKPYSGVSTVYPASLQKILNDVCNYCGVILNTQQFTNYNYVIQARPDSSTLTCLDIVSFVAQIAGCYAKINVQGYLELSWYDLHAFDEELTDGGTFSTATKPYSDGASLDGGNFSNYASGASVDGTLFTDYRPHQLYAFSNFQICTDDVVVTGIKVIVDETEYLYGSDGYALEIANNALITEDNMRAVAKLIGDKIIGMRFRPFSVSALSDPTLESGDAVWILKDGAVYNSYITHITYKIGNYQTFECTAETPSANSATRYSAQTQAYIKARDETKKQISTYDLAVQQLTSLITNSFGVFKTEEEQADGSVVYYLHNKPELSQSTTIWKMTADAFAVSVDGGKTWRAGMDANGNAVVNVLNAIGINADWINAGSLILGGNQINKDGTVTVYDKNGTVLFKVSKDGIIINTNNLKISEKGDIEVQGKLTGMDKLYIRNNIQGVDNPIVQYKWTTENSSYEFFAPDGSVIMRTSEQLSPLCFPQETQFLNAKIENLSRTDFSFSTYGTPVKDGSTGADLTTTVSGTLRQSGVFVLMTGVITLKTLSAGETESIDLTESGQDKQPLTTSGAYFPNHRPVITVGYLGTRVFVIKLSTLGVLSIRNCGSDYENSTGGEMQFRFDYTLM